MKRYQKFMDGVKPSDTLGQRLRALKEPKKKPAWTKYGAMAATLVLVCGLGWYGLDYWQAVVSRQRYLEGAQVYHTEGVPAQPGAGTYEYDDPRFEGMGVVSYIVLPGIDYGSSNEAAEQKIAMDWAIQEGAVERELTQEEIVGLLGGQDVVSVHLDWDSYELSGRIWEQSDGSILMVLLGGYQGPMDHFEFSVMDGQLPPTCIAHENSVTQEVQGLIVTADKYDGEHGCDRRVSFMKGDIGYRFDLTSTDAQQAERLVSRLVRCVADERLALWTLDPKVETYTCPTCGEVFPVGDEKAHAHSFPGVGEPNWDDGAPAVSAQPGYTCPECGETVPAGVSHDCAMCDGYPVPHTCEICGRDYPVGSAHGHPFLDGYTETCPDCGESYAAGTAHSHTCQTCGESYAAGTAHSHRQEGHHGGHH